MNPVNALRYCLAAMAGLVLFSGCLQDKCERTQQYVRYDPVYMTEEGIRVDIEVQGPRELQSPGNIYFYNNYLLINEVMEGVHIIDNRDPENPVNVAFIEIPGNRDIAVQNDILYADMFIDLVAIDISDVLQPELVCRVENIFSSYYPFSTQGGFIIEYVATTVVEELDCSESHFGSGWWRSDDFLWVNIDVALETTFDAAIGNQSSGQAGAPGVGIAGSMARFTTAKGHLYTLDQWQMHVFDLSSSCPVKGSSVQMQWGIETLFPYQDYLFVGSQNGMLIYDNAEPSLPEYLSEFSHAQACDPVFVSNDVAYVTLRDGNTCQNFINQLDVIDVSDIRNPTLIRTHAMQHPHGLSVVEETLFLCEGEHGLKIFDASDHQTIAQNRLSWINSIHAYDVIVLPQSKLTMVIGDDGLYQYNAVDASKPVELSKIPISR